MSRVKRRADGEPDFVEMPREIMQSLRCITEAVEEQYAAPGITVERNRTCAVDQLPPRSDRALSSCFVAAMNLAARSPTSAAVSARSLRRIASPMDGKVIVEYPLSSSAA